MINYKPEEELERQRSLIDKHPKDWLIPQINSFKDIVQKYSTIIVFIQRHNDYDAIASSISLASAIKFNYKKENKSIYIVGFRSKQNGVEIPEEFVPPENTLFNDKDTLGIVIDVCHRRQISSYELIHKCSEFVIIDHHKDHKLYSEWIKDKKILLILNDHFRSCSGLMTFIFRHLQWYEGKDAQALLAKGHYHDSCLADNSNGVWETCKELSECGVDVMSVYKEANKWPLHMILAVAKILTEAEKDGKCLLLTFSKAMITSTSWNTDNLFTFPLKFLHQHLKIKTIVYFHFLLHEGQHPLSFKNIFVVTTEENLELERVLLENGFIRNKAWYYKLGDVMEFREFYNAHKGLFNR